jgi:hypothetical protein
VTPLRFMCLLGFIACAVGLFYLWFTVQDLLEIVRAYHPV